MHLCSLQLTGNVQSSDANFSKTLIKSQSIKQYIWADAHKTRDSISLISYAGCLGLSAVYFSKNSL